MMTESKPKFTTIYSSSPNTPRLPRPTLPIFTPQPTLLESLNVTQIDKSPYMQSGPELPVSIWEAEGGVVRVRVDMPGVNKVVVEADEYENAINFTGFEEEITMHGIGIGGKNGIRVCRVYQGNLQMDPIRFPVLNFTYRLSHGVLSFRINSLRPATSRGVGVVLKPNKAGSSDSEITRVSAINPLVSLGLDRSSIHEFNDKKSFVFAVDMPGIGELDTVTLNVVDSTIHFSAEDKTTPVCYGESAEEDRRAYDGYFKVNLLEFDPSQAQFEIVHGVLWIMLPRKVKPITELIRLFHDTAEPENLYG